MFSFGFSVFEKGVGLYLGVLLFPLFSGVLRDGLCDLLRFSGFLAKMTFVCFVKKMFC